MCEEVDCVFQSELLPQLKIRKMCHDNWQLMDMKMHNQSLFKSTDHVWYTHAITDKTLQTVTGF